MTSGGIPATRVSDHGHQGDMRHRQLASSIDVHSGDDEEERGTLNDANGDEG